MYEVIIEKPKDAIVKVLFTDIEYSTNNRIYLCEKGIRQSILVFRNAEFFWRSFYLDQQKRTSYSTFKEALESRFEKGYKVFVCCSKAELKDMIKIKSDKVGMGWAF